jgi:hypothetical protein
MFCGNLAEVRVHDISKHNRKLAPVAQKLRFADRSDFLQQQTVKLQTTACHE